MDEAEKMLAEYVETLADFGRASMGDDLHTDPSFDAAEAVWKHTVAERAVLAAMRKAGGVPQWQTIDSAPKDGFFLAWSPDYPDIVKCWRADLFHAARKPGTPQHLTANHWTHWRPIDTPAAPQPLALDPNGIIEACAKVAESMPSKAGQGYPLPQDTAAAIRTMKAL
jgi:hypothetical protein